MPHSDFASGRNNQHQITIRIKSSELSLMSIVGPQFAFQRFDVLFRSNAFRAVIEFHAERKAMTIRSANNECTIGVDREDRRFERLLYRIPSVLCRGRRLQTDAIFAGEMLNRASVPVPADNQMNQQFRQTERVMMMPGTHRLEIPAFRHCRLHAVQQSITITSQLEITRRTPITRDRIRPALNKSQIRQQSQSTTQIVLITKWQFKRLTQTTQLSRRYRNAIDSRQQFDITRADSGVQSFCHLLQTRVT